MIGGSPRILIASLLLTCAAGALACGAILGIDDGLALGDGGSGSDAQMQGGCDAGGYCLSHCSGTDMCGQKCPNNCSTAPGWSCATTTGLCGCTHDPTWCDNRCGTITDNCGHAFDCPVGDGGCCIPDANPCATQSCGATIDSCGNPTLCGAAGACASGVVCADGSCPLPGDGGDDGSDGSTGDDGSACVAVGSACTGVDCCGDASCASVEDADAGACQAAGCGLVSTSCATTGDCCYPMNCVPDEGGSTCQ